MRWPRAGGFIAQLFGIEQALEVSCAATLADDPVFVFKKLIVQRRARPPLLTDASVKTFGELDQWLTGQTASSPWRNGRVSSWERRNATPRIWSASHCGRCRR
ncbi:MAG: hypothetical protein ACYDB1_06700 [Acidiferrobacteraceae bacterium]